MIDSLSSISLLGLLVLVAAAYGVRVLARGRARHARIDQEGGGPLVGRRSMEMVYWALSPLGRGCARLSITASQISWLSLVLGLAAGVAIGAGHPGLGALIAAASLLGDGLDGMVARIAHSASDRGELLDAAVDRYVEMFLLGGVAVAVRTSAALLLLTLTALAGSVMVSYATAKAEALRVVAPRGIMRRTERTTILTLALALSPLAALLRDGLRDAPITAALIAIGALANVSAVHRLFAIARAIPAPQPREERAPTAEPAQGAAAP